MTLSQKECVTMMRSQGDSYAKIAVVLGIPENTIKSYCRRKNKLTNSGSCPECGKPLTVVEGKKQKKYCSDKCRMAWWKAHPDAINRKAVYTFHCAVCGVAFESYGNAGRKYCSRDCFGISRRMKNG